MRNFLLLQHHRALGAAVCSTALVQTLQAAVPDARVAIGASGMSREIYAQWPGLDALLDVPDPRDDRKACVAALRGAKLFGGEAFVAVLPMGSSSFQHQRAALESGAAACAHFGGAWSRGPTQHYDKRKSRIANDLGLLKLLGHGEAAQKALAADARLYEPRMYVKAAQRESVRSLLEANGVAAERPVAVMVTQTRVYPPRHWPVERFREVAAWLAETVGMQVVFTGTAQEREAIDALRAPLTVPSANLAGRTGLLEMAALMERASVVFAFDTGAMHVARAMDAPMVVLAPAGSAPVEWLPLGSTRARVLYTTFQHGGWPESVPGEMSAAEVQAALGAVLAEFPPRRVG
jgi:ADP-heptose:LPS heptosyltransferase